MTDKEYEEYVANLKPVTDVAGTIDTLTQAIDTLEQYESAEVKNPKTNKPIGKISLDEIRAMQTALAMARSMLMGAEPTGKGVVLANRLISWYGGLKFNLVGKGYCAGKITVVGEDDGEAGQSC